MSRTTTFKASAINATTVILEEFGKGEFTRTMYNERVRTKWNKNLPTIETLYDCADGILTINRKETFTMTKNGKTFEATRYFYKLDRKKFERVVGISSEKDRKRFIRACSISIAENDAKIAGLAKTNNKLASAIKIISAIGAY